MTQLRRLLTKEGVEKAASDVKRFVCPEQRVITEATAAQITSIETVNNESAAGRVIDKAHLHFKDCRRSIGASTVAVERH